MISRSLGPEIGGAMGITFFFAQSFSIAFYVIGFSLSLQNIFPEIPQQLLSIITLILITLVTIIDANLAIRLQYIILAIIILSLCSFFFGNISFKLQPELYGNFKDASFWKTFSIFFPAVTGILAGASLSGDLKAPAKNIPIGTILSIIFTGSIYILVAIFFAYI